MQKKNTPPSATASPAHTSVSVPTPSIRPVSPATRRHAVSGSPIDELPATPAALTEPDAPRPIRRRKSKRFSLGLTISGIALMSILGITGYTMYEQWKANGKQVSGQAVVQALTGIAPAAEEGKDESDVATNAVDSYKVASDAPRVLSIEKLGIKSRVMPMGVNSLGAIQAPVNIFDSGWYTGSVKPGVKGASLIDGHASGATRKGLFAYLDTLNKGDKITIERGDGKVFTYSVVHKEAVDLDTVDMKKVLKPYEGVQEAVNLITCTGTWVAKDATYDKRVIIYTERI